MFAQAYQSKIIYIFTIDDDAHKGLLKIGDTTFKSDMQRDVLNRIKDYTNTAGIVPNILHVEEAVKNNGEGFRDYDVHRVLKKFKTKIKGTTAKEWFRVDLKTAIKAIQIVKGGKRKIPAEKFVSITFRPEQKEAISRTVEYFKSGGKDFLWNAKMRFGKTLCALEVAKLMNFSKTIILTHRPVVNQNWYEDFDKIFHDTDYDYFNRDSGIDGDKNFVYFASLQDLRGSEIIGGKFDKNAEIFETDWDFVIVDEAHEGTQTALGDTVIKNIVKENSKFLALSGTPFNILANYGDNVYTWDYVDEQRAKAAWYKNSLEANPYADLPAMNIYTYDLGKLFNYLDTDDKFFNFKEFFRTDGNNFVHAADVQKFLNLLTTAENYPYSRADWRNIFKHAL